MIIIGAGMAGLLAARMLAHRSPVIWEAKEGLPNNHSAVLRFRTSQVGDILGIPFKRVNMIKDTLPWLNPIADSLAYSFKNSGAFRSDRSVTRGLVSEERFIAPPDLIERMAERVKIEFGRNFDRGDIPFNTEQTRPVISTVPMPVMMETVSYDFAPDFTYRPGATITALIQDCEAYVSLLVPRPASPFSRISITGNQLIVEVPYPGEGDADQLKNAHRVIQWASHLEEKRIVLDAAELLGIPVAKVMAIGKPRLAAYSKIIPIADETRRDFMFHATNEFGIYSLGRYATWRPGLLLDDLVQDIRLIDKWIGQSKYDLALRR